MQIPFHSFVKARELENSGDLLAVYASSNIKIFPYQIAAAQFALRSPYLKGVILCDEGSLGKTYEAMLIAVQKWYEGAKVAIVVTIPLYMQWKQLIEDRFTIPLEELNLMTYEDAIANAESLAAFNVIIFDEAHTLKNHETKIPHQIPITIEYEMSAEERQLYDAIENYLSRETKTAFLDMDEHRLALKMFRSFSSSTFALIKFLSGVDKRMESGEERDEIAAMLELARSIQTDTKAVELVKALRWHSWNCISLAQNKRR